MSGGARKGKSQRRGGENSDNFTGSASASVAMWHDAVVSELRPKTKHAAVVSLTCASGREMWPRKTHVGQVTTVQDQLFLSLGNIINTFPTTDITCSRDVNDAV